MRIDLIDVNDGTHLQMLTGEPGSGVVGPRDFDTVLLYSIKMWHWDHPQH